MCRFCWIINAVLVAGLAVGAYIFMVRGDVIASSDGRKAIRLTAGERDLVLVEMRAFLESVKGIVTAVNDGDMGKVAASARAVGNGAAQEVPVSLMAKLPLEFKTLGLATHSAFDDLVVEAEGAGDGKVVMTKLAKLMDNCTTCHAGYRLDVDSAAANR